VCLGGRHGPLAGSKRRNVHSCAARLSEQKHISAVEGERFLCSFSIQAVLVDQGIFRS
jgi:hypothetical protein